MTQQLLSDRQAREREFYADYCRRTAPHEVCFDPADPAQSRPWNPYWFTYELVRDRAGAGRRLLDFGCGPGDTSILFCKMGYEVSGFDITPDNIATARRLAARYGMEDRAHFQIMSAERLEYADNSFDVVAGIDILHHVDIPRAMRECMRVLKPGGMAVFREPAEAPLFDTFRHSWLGRRLYPAGASLDRHVTEDERKLNNDDLNAIRAICPNLQIRHFRLISRLDKFLPQSETRLEKIDAWTFCHLPPLNRFGGTVVLMLNK